YFWVNDDRVGLLEGSLTGAVGLACFIPGERFCFWQEQNWNQAAGGTAGYAAAAARHWVYEVAEGLGEQGLETPENTGVVGAELEWQEHRSQCVLLRDLFGNPCRPVPRDPAWLAWHSGTIPQLAHAIYDDRDLPSGHLDPHRLAVLADALEDAGCSDQEI